MSPPFFIVELYPAPEPYASKVFSCATAVVHLHILY
jgi:hypothetical protein